MTRRAGYGRVGAAFGVGYLLRLPADVFYAVVVGKVVQHGSMVDLTLVHLEGLFEILLSLFGLVFLFSEVLLLGTAFLVWVRDGTPGLASFLSHQAENGDGP